MGAGAPTAVAEDEDLIAGLEDAVSGLAILVSCASATEAASISTADKQNMDSFEGERRSFFIGYLVRSKDSVIETQPN